MKEGELLNARRLSNIDYCPRRFWLMDVAAAFDENQHTVLGSHAHRRVDAPVAATEDDGVSLVERGAMFSSEGLGVSCKLDRVVDDDQHPGCVMPIDTKKGGAPRDGLWPADEVQVVLQAMLLREHGHNVKRAGIYSAKERRRIVIDVDDAAEARARAAIAGAREVAAQTLPPPPLVDSPKCPGCSLIHICQPDELVHLQRSIEVEDDDDAPPAAVRRVTPVTEDKRNVVVSSSSASVHLDKSEIVVRDRDDNGEELPAARIGVDMLAGVSVFGRAQVSTSVVHALARAAVPIAYFSSSGYFTALLLPQTSNRIDVRIAQHNAWRDDKTLAIARVLIEDKIANGRTLVRRHRLLADEDDDDSTLSDGVLARLTRLSRDTQAVTDAAHLLAVEGEAAKKHWAGLSTVLSRHDAAFAMQGRTRRPPRDATNAMVSFLSGMLVRDCVAACHLAGLDPHLSVYHTPHHGRPSMALDLMEPFRPLLVDSVVLSVVGREEVTARGFVRVGDGVSMDKDTRRALAVGYERRASEMITHPVFGYRIPYRSVLAVQARLLARVLTGELKTLPHFKTR